MRKNNENRENGYESDEKPPETPFLDYLDHLLLIKEMVAMRYARDAFIMSLFFENNQFVIENGRSTEKEKEIIRERPNPWPRHNDETRKADKRKYGRWNEYVQ